MTIATIPTNAASPPPPARPVVCAGSPRDIGLAQGAALADRVRGSHDVLRRLEAFQLLRPRLLPHGLFVRMAERRASGRWRREVAPKSPAMAARTDGVAAGAGLRRGSLHLLNLLEPLMSDVRAQVDVPPLGGCSALAVGPRRSTRGEPMIARNFDYLPLIQPFYALRETRPDGGLRSLDFTVAPLAGAVDGVNEAGLCITTNYAYVTDAPSGAGTISMAVAEALACCRTVEQAGRFLAGRERWGGGLLMLADESGEIASLELSNGRAELRRATADEGHVLFHSNRFHTTSMQRVEVPPGARFTQRAPAPLRGRVLHASSLRRDDRFTTLLASGARLSADDVRRIMADHGPDDVPDHETICMHGDYWATTATVQLLPRSRSMRVAFDAPCRATFHEFELLSG